MAHSPIPNLSVWSLGQQYVEAAEVLLNANCLLPAAVLSALALEVLLKSFLAENDDRGRSTTEFGHNLPDLLKQLTLKDGLDLITALQGIDPDVNLSEALHKFNIVFTKARYFYEPAAPFSVSSEIIYLARNLCSAVFQVAKQRGS